MSHARISRTATGGMAAAGMALAQAAQFGAGGTPTVALAVSTSALRMTRSPR